jgi:hypothetical protein
MTWPLGDSLGSYGPADQEFVATVEKKLKAVYDGISPSSVSGAPLRKRIEAAMKHVAVFRRQAEGYLR